MIGLAAILLKAYSKKYRKYSDISVPTPTTKRDDLLFGYYGSTDSQVEETRDHINVFMCSQWDGPDKSIADILSAKMPTILDVHYQVFELVGESKLNTVRVDAETRLREFLTLLKDSGAISYIKYIYPIDEPNNNVVDIGVLTSALTLIKKVVSEFSELNHAKYAVIYASGDEYTGQDMYDVIGYDDYDKKSSILSEGYQKLKRSLKPNQTTILVPGGSYLQDPTPFVNFAQSNKEVEMILAFLWADDKWGTVGKPGIRSNAVKDAYIAAGKSIIN